MTANETITPELAEPLQNQRIAIVGPPRSTEKPPDRRHARRSNVGPDGRPGPRLSKFMVLASGPDDLAAVDLVTGAMVRLRMPIEYRSSPDLLKPFDLIQAEIGVDPERDDLAQPEAMTIAGPPRVVGAARKHWARRHMRSLVAPTERHLLGFAGSAAPYWEFRGMRPSLALVAPTIGPLLFRRKTDETIWVRFGWSRSDNWLPVEDPRAIECLWAAGRDKLTGKDLATAIGFRPRYLLAALSPPRGGHCYKTVLALLPRP
jgi:hypothetical protein